MKLDVKLSKSSIDDAIKRLELAKTNLEDSNCEYVNVLASVGLDTAREKVHVCSGDLKESIHIEEESPSVVYLVADVAASSPCPDGRRKKREYGKHYAATEEFRAGEHSYMTPAFFSMRDTYLPLAMELIQL